MKLTDRAVILRYHEVALKGGNRGWFEERLAGNAKKLILQESQDLEQRIGIKRERGRIILYTPWNDRARSALERVFGIASFSPVRLVETNLEALSEASIEALREHFARHGTPANFRVEARRSDKVLAETSTDIDRIIGARVLAAFPSLKVNLTSPQLILGVEVRRDQSFVWTEKVPGPGGLPAATNGRVLTLISGGLDSPVAALQAIKRGAATSFLHFYGTPFVDEEALNKVKDLVQLVNRYQPDPQPLLVVPFGKIQEKIALATNAKLRTVLYRRMMVRIACEVAKKRGAQALISGESLGQVASQTLENLSTINSVATLPILRPLITFDKSEIIAVAKRIGTFETSVRPAADCCTLFADRHPTLKADEEAVLEQEARFDVSALVQEALANLWQ